jgi:hypothetical protein
LLIDVTAGASCTLGTGAGAGAGALDPPPQAASSALAAASEVRRREGMVMVRPGKIPELTMQAADKNAPKITSWKFL